MIIIWLPRALKNRDAQLDYIAAESPQAVIDQGDRIEHQVNMLAVYPDIGRSGRKPGTRELVVTQTPFVVVYRIRPKAQRIEILRILHGAQQWPPA